ncbi:MAG: hypothetical protein ACRC2T_00385 [Thermoguttaceae bacterium]
MTNEQIQELRERIAGNQLEDADDLLSMVQISGRLAALGDDNPLKKLPSVFNHVKFRGKITEIFVQRCKEGIWDVQERLGEPLAFALIDAQDFSCFWRRTQDILPKELAPYFEAWWDACETTTLDEETAEILREFLIMYPLPEEERLPVVNTPITEYEYKLLDKHYDNVKIPMISLRWHQRCDKLTEIANYGDESPSNRMKQLVRCPA